jgi:O-methyltransferase
MSGYLPGRRIHLFDTFMGFDQADVALDRHEDLVEDFIDFSSTHPSAVKQRFPNGELVHLHIGRFPHTTDGVDETFAMVSIDADLYAPVLSGLRWFYPRLSVGGAILVHDYNNAIFGGAKKAVREFRSESGAPVVPLADWGGTAVLVKPGPPA